MLNWIQSRKNESSDSKDNNFLNLENKEYSKIKVIFKKNCEVINEEINKFINVELLDGKEIIELSNQESRNRIFDIFDSNNSFVTSINRKKKVINLKENLESIKEILLNLIYQQEKELNDLIDNKNNFFEKKNDGISTNEQINSLTQILCNKILLNITCILGYISTMEHSLWVNIISLLIVFEIRNCQYFTLMEDKCIVQDNDMRYMNRPSINIDDTTKITLSENIEEDNYLKLNSQETEIEDRNLISTHKNQENCYLFSENENFVILSWLKRNDKEFFSLLLKYYIIIPINYKVGEVLRDISTLLNLAQGPGIVDKKINRTFPIPDSFRNKSFEIINNLIYEQGLFTTLIKLSGNQFFDISSDSISTLRCYLFISPIITSEYIFKNQDVFFLHIFQYLIQSKEYVPQRHGLRLLNQLLSIKEMSKVMTSFSSNCVYLKVFMKLITSNLNTTSFEAFHIFKLFVANPNKSSDIRRILLKNKDSIIKFLNQFQNSRTDPQFVSDKQVSYLILHY